MDFVSAASTVDIERLFSRGRLLLSHICNHLSAENTRALLCVGNWSRKGFIKDDDILAIIKQHDADEQDSVEPGWDRITISF